MLRRTAGFAAALLAVSALVLTACTGGGAPADTGEPDPNASISVRLVLEPTNLDIRQTAGAALDQILIDNVYQGLVALSPDQKDIVPRLASDYTVSADGLTYTFTVRDGVTFQNGQPLTPQDVVWSLTTRRDTSTWADSSRLARVQSITANGNTVTLQLSQPDSTLLWNLAGRAGLIFKEGDTVDYKTKTNGTGPFVLGSWKQGDSITFERNDAYWGPKALAKEVVFEYIPDNQAALSAALAGNLDVVTGFDPTLGDQIKNAGFTLALDLSTDKGTLAMNEKDPALGDIRVRQAIRQAIDHDAIVKAVGAGQKLCGPIPELDPGYQDLCGLVPYDPAAAKQLLAQAGYANGLTLTLTIPSFYGTTIPQILVSDLAAVGITLTVNSVDFTTWLNDVFTNKNYQLSYVLHTEARDFENWANPDYYFTYDNPQVKDLYEQARSATTPEQADALLAQAAQIVSKDAAADWLYNGASVVAVAPGVTGVPTVNVNARLPLAELAKSHG
ncbi:ABC transporter substrate-binding protein [Microbacterium sp. X-17]|uniref:ABC transporter substrate-binding protein n=1 Tax=Microbacterium sp. X-17 TaxID=3144404 RepID=UPI0031F49612